MISRRQMLVSSSLALLSGKALIDATGASAAPGRVIRPAGPWVQDNQSIKLSGLHSNEQLYAELEGLAARRSDVLGLDAVGRSVEGRPLYLARVGNGPTTLMIMTQQHGDEPLGTEAALRLLKDVTGPDADAQAVRDNLTLLVMPRVNPDGFERYLDFDNLPDGVDPRRNALGFDLNRYWGPGEPPSPTEQPETFAALEVALQYRPDLAVDYHHQVTYVTDEGEMVSMSVRGGDNEAIEESVVEDSQRAAVVTRDAVDGGRSTVSLYPESTNPRVSRNGLALRGMAALLVEQRGQQEVGQKSAGSLVREGLVSMKALTASLATGAFADVDPERFFDIPARGDRVRFDDLH